MSPGPVFDGDHESAIIFIEICTRIVQIVEYDVILAYSPTRINNSESQYLLIGIEIILINPVFNGLSFGIKFISLAI
jgi:hypothetical protein